MYRAAVLMVWAAVIEHLYSTIEDHPGGVKAFEAANVSRYGTAFNYKKIKKRDDFLYLREAQFIVLGGDAGLYNKDARLLLEEKLILRNRCGHHPVQAGPRGYRDLHRVLADEHRRRGDVALVGVCSGERRFIIRNR